MDNIIKIVDGVVYFKDDGDQKDEVVIETVVNFEADSDLIKSIQKHKDLKIIQNFIDYELKGTLRKTTQQGEYKDLSVRGYNALKWLVAGAKVNTLDELEISDLVTFIRNRTVEQDEDKLVKLYEELGF